MSNGVPNHGLEAQGIATGAEAPSIAQPATSGQTLSLQQLRGSKIVVYFYEEAG